MVVVDLGCESHGRAFSLEMLATVYKPTRLYGFDPSPHLQEGHRKIEGVSATLIRSAAWVHDGTVAYHDDGWGSRIGEGDAEVPCFDFSRWLKKLARRNPRIIVKMDIEGAEWAVLEHLIANGTDRLISDLLVEWHPAPDGLADRLSCPVRQWWM